MPGISIAEVLGNYLIVVDVQVFWAYVVAFTLAFAVGVPWLANRPQPTPRWGAKR